LGEVLLVDTVGFIHKLPHGFVDAFKSTLEEVRSAELLLHVVDGSSAHAAEQIAVVERVLGELGAGETPRVTVFNKADRRGAGTGGSETVPRPIVEGPHCEVSALTGLGIPELLEQIGRMLSGQQQRLHVRIPAARSDLLAELHRSGRVAEQSVDDGAIDVTAYVPAKVAGRIRKALAAQREAEAEAARPHS
jgi:GTP-binding protein HflX